MRPEERSAVKRSLGIPDIEDDETADGRQREKRKRQREIKKENPDRRDTGILRRAFVRKSAVIDLTAEDDETEAEDADDGRAPGGSRNDEEDNADEDSDNGEGLFVKQRAPRGMRSF